MKCDRSCDGGCGVGLGALQMYNWAPGQKRDQELGGGSDVQSPRNNSEWLREEGKRFRAFSQMQHLKKVLEMRGKSCITENSRC